MKMNLQLFGGRGGGSGLSGGAGANADVSSLTDQQLKDRRDWANQLSSQSLANGQLANAQTAMAMSQAAQAEMARRESAQTTQKTMRDASNGFEFSPEKNKNTGTRLTSQPSAQDLINRFMTKTDAGLENSRTTSKQSASLTASLLRKKERSRLLILGGTTTERMVTTTWPFLLRMRTDPL